MIGLKVYRNVVRVPEAGFLSFWRVAFLGRVTMEQGWVFRLDS